jgi:diguanylate cyclase (GGDEF)-like protein
MDLARRLRPSENLELNSALCVPLLLGKNVVGTLTLYHSSYSFYQPYHVERLERVARYAVQAIEQTQSRRLELPLPCDDPITQLPNAYSLMQFLAGQLNVSQTREDEFTVIQLNLEAVEKPAPGTEEAERNRAMCRVARILQDTVREGDFVARSSANSFTLVLPGCGEREARRTARRVLEKARVAGMNPGQAAVVMRVGIAVYRRDGSTVDDLLRVARERLAELSPQPLMLPALAGASAGLDTPAESA